MDCGPRAHGIQRWRKEMINQLKADPQVQTRHRGCSRMPRNARLCTNCVSEGRHALTAHGPPIHRSAHLTEFWSARSPAVQIQTPACGLSYSATCHLSNTRQSATFRPTRQRKPAPGRSDVTGPGVPQAGERMGSPRYVWPGRTTVPVSGTAITGHLTTYCRNLLRTRAWPLRKLSTARVGHARSFRPTGRPD